MNPLAGLIFPAVATAAAAAAHLLPGTKNVLGRTAFRLFSDGLDNRDRGGANDHMSAQAS